MDKKEYIQKKLNKYNKLVKNSSFVSDLMGAAGSIAKDPVGAITGGSYGTGQANADKANLNEAIGFEDAAVGLRGAAEQQGYNFDTGESSRSSFNALGDIAGDVGGGIGDALYSGAQSVGQAAGLPQGVTDVASSAVGAAGETVGGGALGDSMNFVGDMVMGKGKKVSKTAAPTIQSAGATGVSALSKNKKPSLEKGGGASFRYHGKNKKGHHEVSAMQNGRNVGYAVIHDGEVVDGNLPRNLHRDAARHVDKENSTSLAKNKNYVSDKERMEVSFVAVINGNKILMAKRNDTGKWTLPGGHLEDNESPFRAACRELWEEAGIKQRDLQHINSEFSIGNDGQRRKIHSFVCFGDFDHSTENDPDNEVSEWVWVDLSNGLPEKIKRNLHTRRNCTLKCLGLISY